MLRAILALCLAIGLAAPAHAGDGHGEKTGGIAQKGDISVTGSWVRAALPNRPTAGYLKIATRAAEGDRLIAAHSEKFEVIEIHRTTMENGRMSMAPIEAVEVPAGGEAVLEPGGAHLMLFGGGALKEGERVTVTLVFETAGEIEVLFKVQRKPGGAHKH